MTSSCVHVEHVRELGRILQDFSDIGLKFELVGGMKNRGFSNKDIDLSTHTDLKELPKRAWSLAQKWDSYIRKQYGLGLDLFVHFPQFRCTMRICGNTVSLQKLYRNRLDPETSIVDENGEIDEEATRRYLHEFVPEVFK